MTLKNAFSMTGATGVIAVTIMFYMWFALTIAVLCVMEGTSAMLHSLRLLWVEMMYVLLQFSPLVICHRVIQLTIDRSKSFMGDGVAFQPFSFKILLEEEPVE